MKWLSKHWKLLKKARSDLKCWQEAWCMRHGVHATVVLYIELSKVVYITIAVMYVIRWCASLI